MRCVVRERTALGRAIDSGGRSVITGHGCTVLLMWTLLACLHAGLVSGFYLAGWRRIRFGPVFLAGDARQFKRTCSLTISRDKSSLPFYQGIESSIMAQSFTNSHTSYQCSNTDTSAPRPDQKSYVRY